MLVATKRTALDNKVWWVAFDTEKQDYSTDMRVGKYKTKKECQYYIDKINNERRKNEK